jgi:hypothetical protein
MQYFIRPLFGYAHGECVRGVFFFVASTVTELRAALLAVDHSSK